MTKPPAGVFTAPLPVARRFTLLDAATIVEGEERTGNGATIEDYPHAMPSVQYAFASGSARVKAIDGAFTNEDVGGFTAYLGVTCTAAGVKPREQEFRRRLQAAFRAVESTAVESWLVDTAGNMGGPMASPYLTDTNLEELNSGAATSPVESLALLENAIALVGNGMIHATPGTATAWASRYLVEEARDGQMRTRLGTLVAVGAGYIGAYPEGGSPATGDQEWAFASGFVEIHRDEDMILDALSTSLERQTNDVTLIAERNYVVAWVGRQADDDTNHVQAGVLVDRSI